jgi:hypothetical protein
MGIKILIIQMLNFKKKKIIIFNYKSWHFTKFEPRVYPSMWIITLYSKNNHLIWFHREQRLEGINFIKSHTFILILFWLQSKSKKKTKELCVCNKSSNVSLYRMAAKQITLVNFERQNFLRKQNEYMRTALKKMENTM